MIKEIKYKPVKNDMNVLSTLTTRTKNADLAGRIVFNEKMLKYLISGNTKINQ
jgi:hypothetical protein